ncbi:glycosyltransferase, partial [Chamaesiphon sp. VAR_69_metabat_338]|uniref:glycosyltransferase n=1 Tax=Chamaesiphon sp. VAR_69_metabat_338 TaxID=2964704 RepID=UPI00286E7C3E
AIGHLNPMCTIARELLDRGHRVTLFGVPDIQARVATVAGLEFAQLGATEFPLGAIDRMYKELGRKSNLDGLKYTLEWMGREVKMLFAEAPAAIEASSIDLLLVDQVTGAGSSIAAFLNLPFVTICNALPIDREPMVPPFFTTWTYQNTWWARARNQLGNLLLNYLTETVWQQTLTQRRAWKLPPLADREAGFSQLLQISQLPPEFDFPRKASAQMHYVGPFLAPATAEPISFAGLDFPFDRLTDKPLIYASLGTLQNQQLEIFNTIAAACVDLDAQLVISLGDPERDPTELQLPGNPIVVAYAPHAALIARSSLVVTHAGLNTTIGSLSAGVPLVAIPITNEQPGIATRIVRTGAGEMVPLKQLTVDRLKQAIHRVLTDSNYRTHAHRMQSIVRQSGGVKRAVDLILSVC